MHIGWRPLRTASALASLLHLLVSTCVPPLLHIYYLQTSRPDGSTRWQPLSGLNTPPEGTLLLAKLVRPKGDRGGGEEGEEKGWTERCREGWRGEEAKSEEEGEGGGEERERGGRGKGSLGCTVDSLQGYLLA